MSSKLNTALTKGIRRHGRKAWQILGAFSVAIAIAACGGGGSSNLDGDPNPPTGNPPTGNPPPTNPPPTGNPPPSAPPSGKLSANPADCVVVLDGSTCQVMLSATELKDVSGAVAIFGPDGNSLPARADVPVEVSLGKATYTLKDGTIVLDDVEVSASCGDDLVEVDGVCANPPPEVLHYSIVVGMPSGTVGLPARISGETCATTKIEEAVNKTSYPDNPELYKNFVLFNSMIHATMTPSGRLFVGAQVAYEENKLKAFLYNPVTNEVMDNDGSAGEAPRLVSFSDLDPGWVRISESDHSDPDIGHWVQDGNRLIYVDRLNGNQPLCEDIVDGKRSGTPVVLDVSHDDFGTFVGFWHFSN